MKLKRIKDIAEELSNASLEELPELLESLENDPRQGVARLATKYKNKEQLILSERERLEGMRIFERECAQWGLLAGVDEVGRGPLAGPVMACACIIPVDVEILYLNDSKLLDRVRREKIFPEIQEAAIAYAFGQVENERIDEINIANATYEAMKQAIAGLKVTPGGVLVDGREIPGLTLPQKAIVRGDAKSVSIAAASILAKVTRDRIMDEYDKVYPEYGFIRNKGYGTREHIDALKKYGPCPIHRRCFISHFL